MKNLTKKMTIAAAALMVAAGVAGAQTLKAEIPFGFRAAGTVMTAGSYRLYEDSSMSTEVFRLINEDTHRSVLTIPYPHNTQQAGGVPTLTFECSGTDCALVQVAVGNGKTYGLYKPSLGKGETRVAVIRAVIVNPR
ncbi:MAG TPA: hypothetical protein VNY05_01075 [Candidatus Acidoferrales bacterium]|jgi:hypothetical protein|nr:hypothetical protein [Candidatus Acidoferrales bacterium]